MEIAKTGNHDPMLRSIAPDRHPADLPDDFPIFLPRNFRVLRGKSRKLMKLQHRPGKDKTAVAEFHWFIPATDMELAAFIDAVSEGSVIGKRERVPAQIEIAGNGGRANDGEQGNQ